MTARCLQNPLFELDEGFSTDVKEKCEQYLSNLGIPRHLNDPPPVEENESAESSKSTLYTERKYDFRQESECGLSCEKDIGWFDMALSSGPWDESKKPYFKVLSENDLLTDNEDDEGQGVLTAMTVSTGLSLFSAVPYSGALALTKLELSNKALRDVQILGNYKMVQYVDVSYNAIQDLSPLDFLRHLVVLDASHNEISQFAPKPPPWFMTYLNLSHNRFESVPDVSPLWSLEHLNLSHNQIKLIEHLEGLNYLKYLNLSHNEISVIENINGTSLQTLDLGSNRIERCIEEDNAAQLNCVSPIRLDLSNNLISNLEEIRCINTSRLSHLDISLNRLEHIDGLNGLQRFQALRYLKIEGNRLFSERPDCVLNIISILPNVKYINRRRLTKKEKLAAFSSSTTREIINEMKAHCNQLLRRNSRAPDFGATSCKYLDYDLPVVILVGPCGSRKHLLAKSIAEKYKQYVTVPTIHSTMYQNFNHKDMSEEINAMKLCHVEEAEFNEIRNQGRFLFVDSDFGDLHGLGEDELPNDGKLCLIPLKIGPAHSLKWLGLNVTMILILPSDFLDYSDLLQSYIWSKIAIHNEAEALANVGVRRDEEQSNSMVDELSEKRVNSNEKSISLEASIELGSRNSSFRLNSRSSERSKMGLSVESQNPLSASVTFQRIVSQTDDVGSFEYPMSDQGRLKWCDEDSEEDVLIQEEPPAEYVSYIDQLKISQKEKNELWSLYRICYDEKDAYYENQNLFATAIFVDDVDVAVKKVVPLLALKYNEYFKSSQPVKYKMNEVSNDTKLVDSMKMLTENWVYHDKGDSFSDLSTDRSCSSLTVPFFTPDTSSLSASRSTSLTLVGSKENPLEEPEMCMSSVESAERSTKDSVFQRVD